MPEAVNVPMQTDAASSKTGIPGNFIDGHSLMVLLWW
jgi:hypothetical protein